jgi:hypothetical protein
MLEAQRANVHVPEGLPAKKRDLDAMTEELAKVADFNMAIEREKLKRDQAQTEQVNLSLAIDRQVQKAEQLEAQLKQLHKDIAEDKATLAGMEKIAAKLKPLDEPKDAAALGEEIANARVINQAIDRRAQAERMDEEIKTVGETIEKLDAAVAAHRAKVTDLIAKADYPVPGLGFADDEVTFNGLAFMQASNAEQIKVSIAMGMALNPKLRVMRIKDGSLLDADSMNVVEAMANEHDFQVFVEIVDVTGKFGVYLVDGEIAKIDGEVRKPLLLKPSIGPPRKKSVQKELL